MNYMLLFVEIPITGVDCALWEVTDFSLSYYDTIINRDHIM